jgi:hypothetical protein
MVTSTAISRNRANIQQFQQIILRRSFTKKSESEDEKIPTITKPSMISIDADFVGETSQMKNSPQTQKKYVD